MANIQSISHKKSAVVENGAPKLPTTSQLELGEIAINFADGYETLSIKNNNDEIVTFTNDNYWINKEQAIAAALNDLNDRITSLSLSDDYAAAAQGTPPLAGDTYETAISKLHKVIVDDELITSSALNDLNSRIDNLSLSEDYVATDVGYEPASGDTYEEAISKLHGAILENELTTSAALNDLNARVSDIVVPDVILSEDYEPSSLSNQDLFLEPGDSYETAFSKLEKTINDNENITSAALTDLDSRLNLLHLPQSLDDIPDGSTRKLSDYATTTQLATKQDALVSGTNIKTINNESILGSGNITIQGGSGGDTNVIETVKVNGTALTPDANKAVDITSIPASIVTQDSTHRFVSDTEKTTWNNKVSNVQADWNATTGDAAILNKPPIFKNGANLSITNTGFIEIRNDDQNIEITATNDDIKLNAGGKAYYNNKEIATVDQIITPPVTSVNGQTGAVTLTIPAAVTESTVSGWGFTKNTGTVTGVKMNGTTNNPTNGVVDLGTVLTSFIETDPTVPAWAKAASKPTYTAAEVGALPDTYTPPVTSVNGQTGAVNLTIPAAPGTLNTTATTAQSTSSSEALSGNITLHKVAKTGTYNDLIGKPTIPAAVTESTVSGWGFTKNAGTITGITMNGSSKGTSGVVDLGTVLTSHQSIKTINNESLVGTGNISINGLPSVTSADNGKILQVVNGAWALVNPTSIYSGTSEPDSNTGNNGDLYLQTS